MLAQQSRHLLVQLADLLVDQLQLLQEHLQQSAVDWVELGAGAECVAQLCRCGAQILICQRSQSCWIGFQYCSSAPQTGFQYCAVDSITTSSTCCSISQWASNRRWSGLPPNRRRSNWYSPSTSTSATTTASIFL